MTRRILGLTLLGSVLVILTACGGQGIPPGAGGSTGVNGGALTVQLTQGPPASLIGGQSVGMFATVFNDKNNAGVTWSCTPTNACGSFSPTATGYQVDTLYTAPTISAATLPIQITATSVADSTKSIAANLVVITRLQGQYAFVLGAGNGSFGMVGSVTLDGNGNVASGEADASANGFYSAIPSITGTYTLDTTGHGNISMSLNNTTCCGTLQQTHGITAISNSHLLIAEDDQFNGLTIGAPGSMDLQTAGPTFTASQVTGGYSFTLAGYSHASGANASWGGIFTADGVSALSGGIFDENFGGGAGYSSVPFTGTFTGPDSNGRGTLTFSATPDTPSSSTDYAYYLVTPEVLRITSITNTGNAGNTGSAYGQGSVGTTNAALAGSFIFSDYGFTSDANGGESGAAGGQFTTDGNGNISAGIMDLNAFGTVSTISWTGSTYSIAGSPRGSVTGPSGQTYNIYLTDPNLNLLDPNNTTGVGGALLLETDAADTIGVVIPQTDAAATFVGANGVLLSDQSNLGGCCNSDGGYTGQFTVSTSNLGTFTGEGDFQGQGKNSATPIVGPLSGTFSADGANPGRFTGAITTTPAFPLGPIGSTTPGTENVSYYLANGSQAFVIETDSIAPVFGIVEAQETSATADSGKKAQPKRIAQNVGQTTPDVSKHSAISRRTR